MRLPEAARVSPLGAPPGGGRLEIWGGIECTINRVGDAWHDQFARSGHLEREGDLERIADLGIRTLRYGLLWERIAPHGLDRADWSWADRQVARMGELGIRPIVGLVHHGSGPAGTDLLDPEWPERLAAFARAVAERYPWLDAWTPVNEPLTTGRFSALYGHWYPHARDELSAMTAVANQARAVARAMEEIRAVNPGALLVQTEDLARVHGTPETALQAEFENERRWLTWDLLLGRVTPGHWMWEHLTWLGMPERSLAAMAERPCPPDVLGVNLYVTSERFLDHRVANYPLHLRGGNRRQRYADVEAVRVLRDDVVGPAGLLADAWERYGLPLAVTEAHLGCTREEQVRWLAEVWRAADGLRDGGADVRAVTAWSLLGAYDWNALLVRHDGHYEPGAFDLRAPEPRPTAVAATIRELAAGAPPSHPTLDVAGWWRRPERLLYPPWPETADGVVSRVRHRRGRPVAIVGDGPLARELRRECAIRAIPVLRLDPAEIGTARELRDALVRARAWAAIDARWCPDVDADAARPEMATALAEASAALDVPLVLVSSGIVFGGGRGPFTEDDPVAPDDPQGAAQAALEAAVLAVHPGALVARTASPLAGDGSGRIAAALREIAAGGRVRASSVPRSWTDPHDAAGAILDLLVDGARGAWHLAHDGLADPATALRDVARRHGLDGGAVVATGGSDGFGPACSIASVRGWLLPDLGEALARIRVEIDPGRASSAAD